MSRPLLAQVKLKEKLRSQRGGGGLMPATNPPRVTDLGVYTAGPSLSWTQGTNPLSGQLL